MSRHAVYILIFVSFFLFSCNIKKVDNEKSGVIKITVSILPQAYIVKQIGKDKVSVNVMVPPASSPETYEPGTKKIAELKESSIYFLIGMPFEKNSIDRVKHEYKNVVFSEMHNGLTFRNIEKGHHHGEEKVFEDEIKDPHIWLDPLFLIPLAENTLKALIRLDPQNREFFVQNLIEFKRNIQVLNDELIDLFKDDAGKSFVIYHPAWGYFADRFRIKQIPVEIEGKEPSASEIATLTDFIKKYNVKHIFLQTQSTDTVIKSLALETGTQINFLDPLKENVLENIKESAIAIKKGLVSAKHH